MARTATLTAPQPMRRAIALEVLGRWQPLDCDTAEDVVELAQKVLRDDLRNGVASTGRWVIERYESALRHEYEGITEQLRPLVCELGPCIQQDGHLASRVLPWARDLGLTELRQIALRTVAGAIDTAQKKKGG